MTTETLILDHIHRLRRDLFLLEAVRVQPTDAILDEVHRLAHEAERLTERWAAALGQAVRPRPVTAPMDSGYGLLVELRVTELRLAISQAAMVFIVGEGVKHLCEHLAPLVIQTRELLEDLRRFDATLSTLVSVGYRMEAENTGLAKWVEAVAPDFARPLRAHDIAALAFARSRGVTPEALAGVRGYRPYLSASEVGDVVAMAA
jgi:hypothetical protein